MEFEDELNASFDFLGDRKTIKEFLTESLNAIFIKEKITKTPLQEYANSSPNKDEGFGRDQKSKNEPSTPSVRKFMSTSAGFIITPIEELFNEEYEKSLFRSLCTFHYLALHPVNMNQPTEQENQIFSIISNIISRGQPTFCSLDIEKYLCDRYCDIFSIKEIPNEHEYIYSIDVSHRDLFRSCLCIIDPLIKKLERPLEHFNNSEFASDFYHTLPEHIKQILEPERHFDDGLIIKNEENFFQQRVDFAIETPSGCKWVVEIDGKQHEKMPQKLRDELRDFAVKESGWEKIRIKPNDDIESIGNKLNKKFKEDKYIQCIEENYINPIYQRLNGLDALNLILLPYAVARLQKILNYLMLEGILSISDKIWSLAIIERDISCGIIATDDYLTLLIRILNLRNLNNELPKIHINIFNELDIGGFNNYKCQNENVEWEYFKKFEDLENTNYDALIDISMLRRTGLNNGELNFIEKFEARSKLIIRSSNRLKEKYLIQTAEPVPYNIPNSDIAEKLLEYFLRNIFRKKKFRDGQIKIIDKALKRENVIGLLPTGAGKSLCYQLVTFLQPAFSLVIEPIKSLMIDQHRNLKNAGIDCAAYLSSDLVAVERKLVMKRMARGEYQILFISPERFQIKEFRNELEIFASKHPVGYGVIDEAHCVSEWGHDFRTSYLMLAKTIHGLCKYRGQPPPIYALTGTASEAVLRDIMLDLGIDVERKTDAVIRPNTFDRPELRFRIHKANSIQKMEALKEVIKELIKEFEITIEQLFEPDGKNTYSGLIFCPHVKNTDYSIEKIKTKLGNYYHFNKTVILKEEPPICSHCNLQMVEKTNRRTGEKFYGCPSYPACKYTKPHDINKAPRHFDKIHIFAGTEPNGFGKEAWQNYKLKAQSEFVENDVPLMVTTKSFGMGIDKPNIRYTIHYNIPPSIESFYQEAGRAGRDRNIAYSTIIFSDDHADDADRRLDPKLSADEVWRLQNIKRNQQGDIHRMLYFQQNSFKGMEIEEKNIMRILNGKLGTELGELDIGESIELSITPLQDDNKNYCEGDTEKAIYRLLELGIIEDYTIDFKYPRIYNLLIERKDYREYARKLYEYLKLRKPEFSQLYPDSEEYYKYISLRSDINHPMKTLCRELINFVYTTIEPQRREALANLVDAVRSNSDEEFRKKILRYLSPEEEYAELFNIFPQSTDPEEWKRILKRSIDIPSNNELLGICIRLLESYPNSVGLRFLASSLRLTLDNEFEERGIEDFKAAVKLSIESYTLEKSESIAKYFLNYHLKESKYHNSNVRLAEHFLDMYTTEENAKFLYLGNHSKEIKKIGAALLLKNMETKTKQLIQKMRQ